MHPKLTGETHTHADLYTMLAVIPVPHGEGEGACIPGPVLIRVTGASCKAHLFHSRLLPPTGSTRARRHEWGLARQGEKPATKLLSARHTDIPERRVPRTYKQRPKKVNTAHALPAATVHTHLRMHANETLTKNKPSKRRQNKNN